MVADRLAVTADRAASDVTVAYRFEPPTDDARAAADDAQQARHARVSTGNLQREESEQ
jgi:hypothetical protein